MSSRTGIGDKDLARYRAGARLRHQADQEALARRERAARALALVATGILRERFNAHRVLLFGSLVHSGCFTDASDVDIAAEGLDPGDTLLAMDTLHRLDSAIPVNLVDMGACSTSMRDCIEREGVEM